MSNETSNAVNPAIAAQAMADNRPKFTFTIPERARQLPTDPRKVTLQLTTMLEEKIASERAKATGSGGDIAYELLKHSVVNADGVAITWEAAGKERFLESCSPIVRQLLMGAYSKLHIPEDGTTSDFFSSMSTTV